jgi:hypothetical protein
VRRVVANPITDVPPVLKKCRRCFVRLGGIRSGEQRPWLKKTAWQAALRSVVTNLDQVRTCNEQQHDQQAICPCGTSRLHLLHQDDKRQSNADRQYCVAHAEPIVPQQLRRQIDLLHPDQKHLVNQDASGGSDKCSGDELVQTSQGHFAAQLPDKC